VPLLHVSCFYLIDYPEKKIVSSVCCQAIVNSREEYGNLYKKEYGVSSKGKSNILNESSR